MTKQAREELVKKMEGDYEGLYMVSLALENFINIITDGERTLPPNLETELTQARDILDGCVSVLHSLIPDPEDS